MIVSAVCSPSESDSTPVMKGPAARPSRFWNSASTEAPVARTPGWTTSITTADTGPTVQVIRNPPSAISANCDWADSAAEPVAANVGSSTPSAPRHSTAIAISLLRARLEPVRSTMLPHTTLPTAPHSTTSAALTAAWSGAMPWYRLRKLGSHDHTAETTISCAAPPRQTHSIVGERMRALTMNFAVLPVDFVAWFSSGVRSTVR